MLHVIAEGSDNFSPLQLIGRGCEPRIDDLCAVCEEVSGAHCLVIAQNHEPAPKQNTLGEILGVLVPFTVSYL